jgi:hypothetical protein
MIDTLLERTAELLYEARILHRETQQHIRDLRKTVNQIRLFRSNNNAPAVRPLELVRSKEKALE